MDPNRNPPTPRKVKFRPTRKPIPKLKPKPQSNETEASEEQHEDRAEVQALLRRWQGLGRREPKVESKSGAQVAFGPIHSSSSLRAYGIGKGVNSGKSSSSASEYFANKQNVTRSSTAIEDQSDTSMIDVTDDTTNASAGKTRREYQEPWDYERSYYPTTLPLRKPNSGDPEILDEQEFGEAATNEEYDENTVNSAEELGLLHDKSEQRRMHFFQLPLLPFVKESVSKKGKEKIGTPSVSGGPKKGSALEELSGGFMGKMLVYKSGAIKLKLGETLFKVDSGTNCTFRQDIVAMNTAQKGCCVLGELSKRVVVTPDLDSIGL